MVRVIDSQQSEWRRHRWQKMNTRFLRQETNKQLDLVKSLPEDVLTWDVYMGLHESIANIQDCLPLIDDLSNPAMRTRHWKQLVRVTGGAVQIDNETLKKMTLGELFGLGLQSILLLTNQNNTSAMKDMNKLLLLFLFCRARGRRARDRAASSERLDDRTVAEELRSSVAE